MKITVERDGEEPQVFDEVSDAYLCVRQLQPFGSKEGGLTFLHGTRSFSWGANVRDIVKEVQQSLVELQDILRESSVSK